MDCKTGLEVEKIVTDYCILNSKVKSVSMSKIPEKENTLFIGNS